jgi:hypothetical protein
MKKMNVIVVLIIYSFNKNHATYNRSFFFLYHDFNKINSFTECR